MNRNENDPARLDESQDHNQQQPAELPWWQHQPCPSWCCVQAHHKATDHPSDRLHYSGADLRVEGRILLSLAPPEHRRDGTVIDEPPCLDTYLAQQWREVEPKIVLSVNQAPGIDLTLSEAGQLQELLQRLLKAASDG